MDGVWKGGNSVAIDKSGGRQTCTRPEHHLEDPVQPQCTIARVRTRPSVQFRSITSQSKKDFLLGGDEKK